jgi:hypothetical protein
MSTGGAVCIVLQTFDIVHIFTIYQAKIHFKKKRRENGRKKDKEENKEK